MSGRRIVRYVPPDAAVTQELPVVDPAEEPVPAPRPRSRAWLVAPLLAILVPVGIGLAWAQRDEDGGGGSSRPASNAAQPAAVVEPVPHAADAEAQARELSTWLRTHSR